MASFGALNVVGKTGGTLFVTLHLQPRLGRPRRHLYRSAYTQYPIYATALRVYLHCGFTRGAYTERLYPHTLEPRHSFVYSRSISIPYRLLVAAHRSPAHLARRHSPAGTHHKRFPRVLPSPHAARASAASPPGGCLGTIHLAHTCATRRSPTALACLVGRRCDAARRLRARTAHEKVHPGPRESHLEASASTMVEAASLRSEISLSMYDRKVTFGVSTADVSTAPVSGEVSCVVSHSSIARLS